MWSKENPNERGSQRVSIGRGEWRSLERRDKHCDGGDVREGRRREEGSVTSEGNVVFLKRGELKRKTSALLIRCRQREDGRLRQ